MPPALLIQLAALSLGLLTGAMLLIAVSLVPHWSTLEPLEFSAWFAANSEQIGRLMVPLGGLATVTAVLAAGLAAARRMQGRSALVVAAASALFIAAVYPLYFSSANAALASGTLTPAEVTAELARWRAWHWARVVAGAVGFAAAIRACSLQVIGSGAKLGLDDVHAFFDRFVSDFASFDGAVIATRYATPYLAIAADGSSRLFQDSAAVAAYFQTVLDEYFSAKVRSCRYHSLEIVPMGSRNVLATVTWEMLREDGEVQASWRESYNLKRTQAGLLVCVSTDQA